MPLPRLARRILVAGLLIGGGIAAASASNVTPTLDRHDSSLRVENGVWTRRGVPFTGTLTDADPSNGERRETPFVDGREHGIARAWFANGAPMFERRFAHGREAGDHAGWYADGRIHFRYHYRDGVLEGRALEWYPNGTVYRDFNYRAGHEEGSQRMWFPDGTARANYVMKDGRRFGLPGSKGCTGSDSSVTVARPTTTD